ncbi:ankyrin repeat-containing protein [Tanacetum coccineum]
MEGSREKYIELGISLYEASMNGDWKAAKLILDKHPYLIRAAITENYETSLHIAASAKNTKKVEEFVRNLVKLMDIVDLELQNKDYNTALNLAAAAGNVKTAKIMVNKNKFILEIPGDQEQMQLYQAALFGRHNMARYLYNSSKEMTGDFWTHKNAGSVLVKCVENYLSDVALKIVNDRPELVTDKSVHTNVLSALAPKTEEFDGAKPHKICRIITSCKQESARPGNQRADGDLLTSSRMEFFYTNTWVEELSLRVDMTAAVMSLSIRHTDQVEGVKSSEVF